MSKYVKVLVSDDFDPETHKVTVSYNEPTPEGYEAFGAPNRITEDATVWMPIYTPVLDHGFVGMVDFMGDDNAVVQAARVSYGNGTKKVSEDRGLLRYLMRHRHTTPFEMVEFKFHVKAPIFVFRQWHRHRTFSINEYSGRYSVMTDEMYLPAAENVKPQAVDNKQGRSTNVLSENDIEATLLAMEESFMQCFDSYRYLLEAEVTPPEHIDRRRLWLQESAVNALRQMRQNYPDIEFTETALDDKIAEYYRANEFAVTGKDFPGLARELARIVLPVATYSQMYWKGNLKNLLHFIALRSDPHAQYEIRVYSDAILDLIRPLVPWTVEAFMQYEFNSGRFSEMELSALKSIIQHYVGRDLGGDTKPLEDQLLLAGSSKREVREFIGKFGL